MSTSTVMVSGMSCGHCVSSVREQVGAIPGVCDVRVDLATGEVTITSEGPVDAAAVKAAVEDAGYQLAA